MRTRGLLASAALLVVSSCVQELDSDESSVSEPRVLAIQAEPAEASPNQTVTYHALVVDQDGNTTKGQLDWFYCVAQKPLAELGPISRDCLSAASGKLEKIGRGPTASGTLPTEACALFGPNPPPPQEDEPPGRPVDPDVTGGYKAPVMLNFDVGNGDDVLLYEQRIACGLSGVNQKLSAEFATRYQRNQNPIVSSIKLITEDGKTISAVGDSAPVEVFRGAVLTVEATWPSCPESKRCGDSVCGLDESAVTCSKDCSGQKGCGGAETYLTFNRASRELETARESLRGAWYATSGTLKEERTGIEEDSDATQMRNTWTMPNEAGIAVLWVVLRDARGGVGFRSLRIRVR